MKKPSDTAPADAEGLARLPFQRWRAFLLLPLLLLAFGCGGGGDSSDPGTPTTTPQPTAAALPDDLAGQWNTILSYVPAYYTGVVPNSDFLGTLGIFLYLQSNGSYQFDLRSSASYFNGNCFRTTHWSETGRASLADGAITFTSLHATDSVLDSCGAARYIDPAQTGTATYTLTREQDQAGWPRLRLRLPGGEDLVLEKCRNCG